MNIKSKIISKILIFIILINLTFTYNVLSKDNFNNYPYQPNDSEIINALDFIEKQQSVDGGIGGISVSSWAAMAISSASQDPHNWENLVNYLESKTDLLDPDKATDWERHTLAVVACNENPRDFAGIDFVEKIYSFYDGTQIGDTSIIYDDFFGILALISAGIDKDISIIQNTKSYILGKQNTNGGWGDADSTAAAIMALISSGQNNNSAVITNALSYLKTLQSNEGGFGSWGITNSASTSWAVMAIAACGKNPISNEWQKNGNNPIDYLISLQQEDGSFNWSSDQNTNPEWMTSYVIPSLLGKYYPVKIYESGENKPPNKPLKPSGEISGFTNLKYTYYTSATDPDFDKIQYRFDWDAEGDHDYSDWTNLDVNGHKGSLSHKWDKIGTYYVKAQARDENGKTSSWSEELVVLINKKYVNNIDEWTGFVRIEGKNDSIWQGTLTIDETNFSAKNVDTGEFEEFYISFPSVLGTLVKAAEIAGFSYLIEYWPSWEAFLLKTIGEDSDWWHYLVDYEIPMVGADKYELTNEDNEVIWGYLEDWFVHALKITVDKDEIYKNEEFTITVFNESNSAVENAIVYVGSQIYLTNTEGNVTVSVSNPGEVIIYSEKEGFLRSEKVKINIKKSIEIIKPINKALYFLNTKIKDNLKSTWIFGAIDIKVDCLDEVEKVEFYIDNELVHNDTEKPFEYKLNQRSFFKKTNITVKSYINNNNFKVYNLLEEIKNLLENNEIKMIYNLINNYIKESQIKDFTIVDSDTIFVHIFNLFPRIH